MQAEKIAVRTSSSVALSLLILKVITGLSTGSVAVLSSAVDSMLDFFVSMFNYVALKTSEKGADESFNYGRGKIEALAAFIEGVIITLSGSYIIYEAVMKLISGKGIDNLGPAMVVMVISVVATSLLVVFLAKVAKKTGSLVVEADSLHYKTDLYTNVGILFSLWVIALTDWVMIDGIVGFCIGIYIIYSAYPIVKKWFLLMLDVAIPEAHVSAIEKIMLNEEGITSFHFLKTRQSGKTYFVQAHLVFKDPEIELLAAHAITDKIEHQIIALDREKTWVVDFHLDPYDDRHLDDGNKAELSK